VFVICSDAWLAGLVSGLCWRLGSMRACVDRGSRGLCSPMRAWRQDVGPLAEVVVDFSRDPWGGTVITTERPRPARLDPD